jgi:CRP/FNR family transcriptional regulator
MDAPRHAGGVPRPHGRCTASELLRSAGLASRISSRTDALTFPVQKLAADTILSRQGDRLTVLFLVLSGALKSECSGPLGETQVRAFYLVGDALGLDALADSAWHGTVTALEPSTVAVLPLQHLLESARELHEMERLFHHLVGREITMRSRALSIVAPPVAEVGVARFLLELASRQASTEPTANVVRLSMSRRDVASHLGIAHETVSRAFTALAETGCIQIGRQAVRILNLSALQQQASRRLGRSETVGSVAGPLNNGEPGATDSPEQVQPARKRPVAQAAASERVSSPPLDPSEWLRTPLPDVASLLPDSINGKVGE